MEEVFFKNIQRRKTWENYTLSWTSFLGVQNLKKIWFVPNKMNNFETMKQNLENLIVLKGVSKFKGLHCFIKVNTFSLPKSEKMSTIPINFCRLYSRVHIFSHCFQHLMMKSQTLQRESEYNILTILFPFPPLFMKKVIKEEVSFVIKKFV